MSRISLVQLAGSVRKSTPDRLFICPILPRRNLGKLGFWETGILGFLKSAPPPHPWISPEFPAPTDISPVRQTAHLSANSGRGMARAMGRSGEAPWDAGKQDSVRVRSGYPVKHNQHGLGGITPM